MFCQTTWLGLLAVLAAAASLLFLILGGSEDQVRNDQSYNGTKEGRTHVSVGVHGALLPFPLFYFGLDFSSS